MIWFCTLIPFLHYPLVYESVWVEILWVPFCFLFLFLLAIAFRTFFSSPLSLALFLVSLPPSINPQVSTFSFGLPIFFPLYTRLDSPVNFLFYALRYPAPLYLSGNRLRLSLLCGFALWLCSVPSTSCSGLCVTSGYAD